MIIIGYPGIGKSTTVNNDKTNQFIDLQSRKFRYKNNDKTKSNPLWYEDYCDKAEELSSQGYCVFVSSHADVINRLKKSKELVVAIYPSISLKNEWIERLTKRYEKSGLEKDLTSLNRIKEKYEEDIKNMKKATKNHIELENINANIKYQISWFLAEHSEFNFNEDYSLDFNPYSLNDLLFNSDISK